MIFLGGGEKGTFVLVWGVVSFNQKKKKEWKFKAEKKGNRLLSKITFVYQ